MRDGHVGERATGAMCHGLGGTMGAQGNAQLQIWVRAALAAIASPPGAFSALPSFHSSPRPSIPPAGGGLS